MTSITGTNAVAQNTVGQREGDVTAQGVVLPQSAVGMSGGGPYVPPLVAAMGMGMHCGVNANQTSQLLPQQYHHFYQTANNSNYNNVAVNRSPYNGTQPAQLYQCPTPQRTTAVPSYPTQNAQMTNGPQPQPFRGNIPTATSQTTQQAFFNVQAHSEAVIPQTQQNTSPQSNPPSNGYVNMWPPQYSTNNTSNGSLAPSPVPTQPVQFPPIQQSPVSTTSNQPAYSNGVGYSSIPQTNGPSNLLQPSVVVNGVGVSAHNGSSLSHQQRISPAPSASELKSQIILAPEETPVSSVKPDPCISANPVADDEFTTDESEDENGSDDRGLVISEQPSKFNLENVEDKIKNEEVENNAKFVQEKNGHPSNGGQNSRPTSPHTTSPPPMAQSTPFQNTAASNALANKIPATLTFGDAIGALVTDRALSDSPSPQASPNPHESPSGSPATSNSSGQSLALSGTPMIMPMANAAPLSPECDEEGGPMDCSVGHGDHDDGGEGFPSGPQGPMTSSSSVSGSGPNAGGDDSNEGSGSGNSKYAFNNYEHVCQFCDYTSRTEGRLKRHIKDFHSEVPPSNYSGQVKVVRSGRPKNYRCKQCSFMATNKVDFWEHSRAHIKEDKLLQCPKCPFVTEYKHHLEYHLRNHFGSKPFKCSKCNYSCVNKSMLNSHMKSHTNVYQYRCADCSYATKYCHSLKLHLRKYDHHAANLMTADGSLVVDEKGELSQSGTNDPGTPNNMPLSMSLFEPNGEDVDMKGEMGEHDEHDEPLEPESRQKPVSSAASSSSAGSGHLESNGPISRLPLAALPGFPGLQDSPGIPSGWPGNDPGVNPAVSVASFASRGMPPQMVSAMSRLVSGEGNQDPAALASLMGAYYQMMGPQGSPGVPPMPATMCAVPNNGQQTTMIKCNTCGFLAPSWPQIMQHVFKVHAAEHNDLFRAFGVSPDVLSDINKCMLPGQFAGAGGLPPAMAAMLASGALPPGVQLPPGLQAQMQQTQQNPSKRRGSHTTSTGSPMAAQNAAALSQFLASQQQGGVARPPGSTAPWPLDLTKSGGSGSGSGSYRGRSSPSIGMNGGGSGSSVSRSTDTPASSSNDAPLTGGETNGLEILCRSRDLASGDPSSPASGGSGSGSGSGTNGDPNGRRRARKGKAVKLSAMRQGHSGGSEGDGEGVTSGSSATGEGSKSVKLANGWEFAALGQERVGSRIDDWSVQPHPDPAAASLLQTQPQIRQAQVGENGSRRQSASGLPGTIPSTGKSRPNATTASGPNFECNHCEMGFRDIVMYTIHMGYHGFHDPFKCNMCGASCRDKVDFFLHIARTAHQ